MVIVERWKNIGKTSLAMVPWKKILPSHRWIISRGGLAFRQYIDVSVVIPYQCWKWGSRSSHHHVFLHLHLSLHIIFEKWKPLSQWLINFISYFLSIFAIKNVTFVQKLFYHDLNWLQKRVGELVSKMRAAPTRPRRQCGASKFGSSLKPFL